MPPDDSASPQSMLQLIEQHHHFGAFPPELQTEARRRAQIAAELLVEERAIAEQTTSVIAQRRKYSTVFWTLGIGLVVAGSLFGLLGGATDSLTSSTVEEETSATTNWALLMSLSGIAAALVGSQLTTYNVYSRARSNIVTKWDCLGISQHRLPAFRHYYSDLHQLLRWKAPVRKEDELVEQVVEAVIDSVRGLEGRRLD